MNDSATRGSRLETVERRPAEWTVARIVSAISGAVLVLCSIGLLAVGGFGMRADITRRHEGYVDIDTGTYRTGGYGLAWDASGVPGVADDWLFGKVRVRVASTAVGAPVFVGIAPSEAADGYLTGVQYATVRLAFGAPTTYIEQRGTKPATSPTQGDFWTARATGVGTQTLISPEGSTDWNLIVMNRDGSPGVDVRVNFAASLPSLLWIATAMLILGTILLVGGAILIAIPVRRARG